MTAHETPDKRRAMIPMVIAILVSLIAGGIAPGLVVVSKAGTCGKAGLSLATGELPSPGRAVDPLEGGGLLPETEPALLSAGGRFAKRDAPRCEAVVRRMAGGLRGRSPPVV